MASRASRANETADRLHSAAIRLLRRVRRQDAASGLSAARLSALSVVVFAGPLRLGDLAVAEQVSPPTVTGLVRGLEGDGLVRRRSDPDDARAVRVEATAKGRRRLERARRRRIEDLATALIELSRSELEIVDEASRLLSRLFVFRGAEGSPPRSTE